MINLNFNDYGVHYNEIGIFHAYIAIVDMGEFEDIRSCLAVSMNEATTAIESVGGKVTALFLLSDALEAMKRKLEHPNQDVLNPVFISNKPSPIV